MKVSKYALFIFIVAGVLFVVILGILFFIINQTADKPSTQIRPPSPSPSPTVMQTNPDGEINYNIEESKRAWNYFYDKQKLSDQDAAAKNKLLLDTLRSITSGVVYENDDVIVEYVQSADIFEATIRTANLSQAKNETVKWFESFGISKEGVCKLPIIFSVDPVVAESLLKANTSFSPLTPGC